MAALQRLRGEWRHRAKQDCRARYIVPLRRRCRAETVLRRGMAPRCRGSPKPPAGSRRYKSGLVNGQRCARQDCRAQLIPQARLISRAPLTGALGALFCVDLGPRSSCPYEDAAGISFCRNGTLAAAQSTRLSPERPNIAAAACPGSSERSNGMPSMWMTCVAASGCASQ